MKCSLIKKYCYAAVISLSLLTSACTARQQLIGTDTRPIQQQPSTVMHDNPADSRPATDDTNQIKLQTELIGSTDIAAVSPKTDKQQARNLVPRESFETIYFGYDSSLLSDSSIAGINRNFNRMNTNKTSEFILAGFCDERGNDAYNIALGERRALAVQKYLVTLGFPQARLRTVSYGKENPTDPGHTEEAWAKNRRVEFKWDGESNEIK